MPDRKRIACAGGQFVVSLCMAGFGIVGSLQCRIMQGLLFVGYASPPINAERKDVLDANCFSFWRKFTHVFMCNLVTGNRISLEPYRKVFRRLVASRMQSKTGCVPGRHRHWNRTGCSEELEANEARCFYSCSASIVHWMPAEQSEHLAPAPSAFCVRHASAS